MVIVPARICEAGTKHIFSLPYKLGNGNENKREKSGEGKHKKFAVDRMGKADENKKHTVLKIQERTEA